MMAMDVWEEQLNIKEPVRFKVTFNENMSPDVEIQTTVEMRWTEIETVHH